MGPEMARSASVRIPTPVRRGRARSSSEASRSRRRRRRPGPCVTSATIGPARTCRKLDHPRELSIASAAHPGEVAEWFKAAVLKTVEVERLPGVRIPSSPPIVFRCLSCISHESSRLRFSLTAVSYSVESLNDPVSFSDGLARVTPRCDVDSPTRPTEPAPKRAFPGNRWRRRERLRAHHTLQGFDSCAAHEPLPVGLEQPLIPIPSS